MAPRTILYTGKGGVGKTSVAAATARACARDGARTLIVSTDPAHSLSDSLGVAVSDDQPSAVDDPALGGRLHGLELNAQTELTRHWSGIQDWLGRLLIDRGLDSLTAQELTVPPGMDELFSLLRLLELAEGDAFDVIIVDCAPTGETLRMLSFPDAAQWWLERVFPHERTLLAAAAPLARTVLDIPLPTGEALTDLHRLSENLIAVHRLLRDRSHTTIRLVMNPDRMVIGEAMRTFTYLNLYGYLTDAVVVNRVFSEDVGDYFDHWRGLQAQHLELVRSAFEPVPILVAPYFEEEVVGPQMLDRLAEALFAGDLGFAGNAEAGPGAVLHDSITQSLTSDSDGGRLRLAIPFTSKEEITLRQAGLELIVATPSARRVIMLPPTLAAMHAVDARYDEGALEITFSRA